MKKNLLKCLCLPLGMLCVGIVGLFGRQYGTDEKNGVYGDRIRIDDHS